MPLCSARQAACSPDLISSCLFKDMAPGIHFLFHGIVFSRPTQLCPPACKQAIVYTILTSVSPPTPSFLPDQALLCGGGLERYLWVSSGTSVLHGPDSGQALLSSCRTTCPNCSWPAGLHLLIVESNGQFSVLLKKVAYPFLPKRFCCFASEHHPRLPLLPAAR